MNILKDSTIPPTATYFWSEKWSCGVSKGNTKTLLPTPFYQNFTMERIAIMTVRFPRSKALTPLLGSRQEKRALMVKSHVLMAPGQVRNASSFWSASAFSYHGSTSSTTFSATSRVRSMSRTAFSSSAVSKNPATGTVAPGESSKHLCCVTSDAESSYIWLCCLRCSS